MVASGRRFSSVQWRPIDGADELRLAAGREDDELRQAAIGGEEADLHCCDGRVPLCWPVDLRCKVTISESEKAKLNDRAKRLLSKPIKFFHEMQELFQGTNADGSLAKDQETCMDDEESDSVDRGGINDMSGYEKVVDIPSDDSDTLPSAKRLKTSPGSAEGGENSSSNTPRSGANRPRPKGMKSPAKKPSKPKSRLSEATEVFSSIMQTLAKAFAEPPPPPPVPKLDHNPYANLWKRLEAMPLRTEDKINVGVYLARPKCEGMWSFLDASSDHTLETWVYQFICGQDGH
ncbi:hypothetical protein EJB05_42483, partial [Eragrostis curvula]